MRYIQDFDVKGKTVLVRADLNVPLALKGAPSGAPGSDTLKDGQKIADDNRIKQIIPTLKFIVERGGKAVVISHLGDPESSRDTSCSLRPVAPELARLLSCPVQFAPECYGDSVQNIKRELEPGQVLLLENLRFHPGEKSNDPQFASQLAKNIDIFINDAFATSHRSHASLVSLPKFFESKGIGFLMQRELEYYERALVKPRKPLCVVLGGLKVSTKLHALINLVHKADKLVIGGAMANTFLAAQGIQMGRSKFEQELFQKTLELVGIAARRDCKLYLPVDFMVGPSPSAKGLGRAVPALEVPADMMALDIGPATSLLYKEVVHTAETVVWNGPMGAFENDDYAKGTTDMIEYIAGAHGLKVVGGGDTVSAINQMELGHKFDYISTGGGAFLALLEGKGLAALTALEQ